VEKGEGEAPAISDSRKHHENDGRKIPVGLSEGLNGSDYDPQIVRSNKEVPEIKEEDFEFIVGGAHPP
jgi:hypothetical protein